MYDSPIGMDRELLQLVVENNSQQISVHFGVCQGSYLGPISFLLSLHFLLDNCNYLKWKLKYVAAAFTKWLSILDVEI